MRRFVVLIFCCLLVGAFVVDAAAEHPARAWHPRATTFAKTVVLADQQMRMSDGVDLHSDVYLPSRDGVHVAPGRFPTAMIITPYNKNGPTGPPVDIDYLVHRGYAFVVAEVRGTGSSPGVWEYGSPREHRDGYDEVEWAERQPWSTGDVGLVGDSYRGFNQWWTAAEQPPHLRAIVPINAPADMYRSGAANGGELSSLVAAEGLVLGFGLQPSSTATSDPVGEAQIRATRPISAGSNAVATTRIAAGAARSYDGPFYHYEGGYWNVDKIDVPALLVGGWYDIAQRDMPLMYAELRRRHVPAKLIMGPWYHTTYGAGLPMPGLPYTIDELVLRWFDRYVADRPDPTLSRFGPVVYELQGQGRFRTASSWPPPGVDYRPLYLTGPAMPGAPGTLASRPTHAAASPDVLPWQPVSGACSRAATRATLGLTAAFAPVPNRCDEDGSINDGTGLEYDLPASRHARTLVGPIAAHLYVSSTGRDAFLDVRIEDVAPDGTVSALTDGTDTLSDRALDRRRTLRIDGYDVRPFHPYTKAAVETVSPGKVYRWSIEILPTAAQIAPGHVLRVTLQPADAAQAFPFANRAPGIIGSALRIYHDRQHPSFIAVPFEP